MKVGSRLHVPVVDRGLLPRGETRPGRACRAPPGPRVGGRWWAAVSASVCPVARPHSRWEDSMHALPWQGPMVIVVYRLRSSIESKPSTTAAFSSFDVTSMHRQANCLPLPRSRPRAARSPGPPQPLASARSASIRSRRRRVDAPSRSAGSQPASRPWAMAASVDAAPATAPTACTVSGTSTGRKPAHDHRRRPGHRPSRPGSSTARRNPADHQVAVHVRCPLVAPGGPTVTPLTWRRPDAARIVEPRDRRGTPRSRRTDAGRPPSPSTPAPSNVRALA